MVSKATGTGGKVAAAAKDAKALDKTKKTVSATKTTAEKTAAKSPSKPSAKAITKVSEKAKKAPAKAPELAEVSAAAVAPAEDAVEPKLGLYRQATADAERMGRPERKEGVGYVLHEYPSYQTYVDVQTAGNKAKLGRQFVRRSHVDRLSDWLRQQGHIVTAGICHGTRAGREQKWFRRALKCTGIFGTEISDTAGQFPFTVQWDFHDENPEWQGKHDFVYSNSWDHAFEPKRAFASWLGQLRKGGYLFLDYTAGQAPHAANALDPFGIEIDPLHEMLKDVGKTAGAVLLEDLDFRDNPEYRARVVVMRKS